MTDADAILAAANARAARRDAEHVPINYAEMARIWPRQKAALTRAMNAKDAKKVVVVCRDAVLAWDRVGAWPDDWARFQRALDDILPWGTAPRLDDLR